MGFCSGTDIFDPVAKELLSDGLSMSDKTRVHLLRVLFTALRNHDWDCQGDSYYWDHPLVQQAAREAGYYDGWEE